MNNHHFFKILRYEYKSNSIFWIYNVIVGVILLTILFVFFHENAKNEFVPETLFPVLILLTFIFTLNSYDESTKSQSMQMYHLLPVSRDIKFFSKQAITFLAFPGVVALLSLLCITLVRMLYFHDFDEDLNTNSTLYYSRVLFWIFGHSISTFFAIIFKKQKILYALLCLFILQFTMGIVLAVVFQFPKIIKVSEFFISINDELKSIFIIGGALIISLFFYILSYRLFFRRQL